MTISDNGKPRGLPEALPADERILLQTTPSWRSLAIHAFHARKIAIYCLALVFWRIASAFAAGKGAGAALADGAAVAPIALAGIVLPALLAWSYARTTIYTITNRRIVLRTGVALPMTFNLPFAQIDSAALKQYADGTGDIPLKLVGDIRLAFAHLWPSVRPWRINTPEPMLRAVADAQTVANVLGQALGAVHRLNPAAAPSMTAGEPVHHLETAAA